MRIAQQLLLWLVLTAPVHGLDLFVDQADPACNNATGTPYCSINAAVASALDGDRVLVGAGTYFESISVFRDITIRGAGAGVTIVSGSGGRTANLTGDVTLEQLTITGNGSGGVLTSGDVLIANCEITGNASTGGGGIRQNGGSLELQGTVVSNNTSDALNVAGGAGIWTTSGNLTLFDSQVINNHNLHSGSPGGGIKFDGSEALFVRTTIAGNTSQNNYGGMWAGGTTTLIECSVYDNEASGSVGGVGGLGSNITLINTTVSGNRAQFTAGVSLGSCCGGSLTLRSSTVYGNESTSGSGSGGAFFGAESAVSNTIIAGNTNPLGGADCSGTFNSEGYNLLQSSSCTIVGDVTGNLLGIDPELLPLADNGGPTWTHAPAPQSPARDSANPAPVASSNAACPAIDQRGVSRPQDGDLVTGARCDIGATEAADLLFADGFESGNTSRWSLVGSAVVQGR